jgi:signal peptidase I
MTLPAEIPPPAEPPAAQNQVHIIYPTPLEAARSFCSILVVALFILTFIAQPFRIPSESMERTLLVGDFLLVNKSIYAPPGHFGWLMPYRPVRRGDIVVFYFPPNPREHVVKRVIGLPGDHIHLKNGSVYRNGQPLSESYAVYEPAYPDNFRDNFPTSIYTDPDVNTQWWRQMRHDEDKSGADLIVPAGDYFVLGDNRNHSRDSRYWGFVPRANIVGRPFIIYFSLRRPSTTDLPALPRASALPPPNDKLDKLNHEGIRDKAIDKIVDFARWTRILRIVR